MNISSNSIASKSLSSDDSTASKSIVDDISSPRKEIVQSEEEPTEKIDLFANIKDDIDSIIASDIDTMSDAELKEALLDLITDMKSVYNQTEISDDTSEMELDNMNESEMKELLKKIQVSANNNKSKGA